MKTFENFETLNCLELLSVNGGGNPSCEYNPPDDFFGALDYLIGWAIGTVSISF